MKTSPVVLNIKVTVFNEKSQANSIVKKMYFNPTKLIAVVEMDNPDEKECLLFYDGATSNTPGYFRITDTAKNTIELFL